MRVIRALLGAAAVLDAAVLYACCVVAGHADRLMEEEETE